jgi:lipopolysaccharide biosynthesis protein
VPEVPPGAPGVDVLALYLPQFHPIPENDAWWEPGFTEWTNLAAATTLFRGHRRPDLPGELGFYDLRVEEVREQQAALARDHGVTGFCWWHYWFAGRRLLERPFDEVLAAGRPDLPFSLCWANQSWSGVWHGAPDRVLMEQTYPDGDDAVHFASLLGAFRDERYHRVSDRPLLGVFRPQELPDARRFVDTWQQLARDAGLGGLYLVAFSESRAWGAQYETHVDDGFDAPA